MNYAPHYPFPPARAYRLNRCLFALKSDAEFLARFVEDPARALDGLGLSEEERLAVLAGERERLCVLGGHPYLIVMAELRVRGARGETNYEYF